MQERARSSNTASKIPVGEWHFSACVRSFPGRSGAKLRLSNHQGAHMRHVHMLTLAGGG